MLRKEFDTLPDHIQEEIMTAPMKCRYQQGKLQVTKLTKFTFAQMQKIIKNLSAFKVGKEIPYSSFLSQNNLEKAVHCNLEYEIATDWTNIVYKYSLEQEYKNTINLHDIYTVITTPLEDMYKKVSDYIYNIHKYIELHEQDFCEKFGTYTKMIYDLRDQGIRKTTLPEDCTINRMVDIAIIEQLSVQTIRQLYFLYKTNRFNADNTFNFNSNFSYNITSAKAPRFWYSEARSGNNYSGFMFSATVANSINKRGIENTFDEKNPLGLSEKALEALEMNLALIQEKGNNIHGLEELRNFKEDNINLPDEEVFGCPVQDSFTKLYRITLMAMFS